MSFTDELDQAAPPASRLLEHGERLRSLVERRRRLDAEIALVVDDVRRAGTYLDDHHRSVAAWCRATVGWSNAEAMEARRNGRFLRDHPDAARVAVTGRLGAAQLDRLARVYANPRCGWRLAEFLPVLLVHAVEMSAADFDQVMDRWVAQADPDGAHRDHAEAHEGRRCRLGRLGVGFEIRGSFGAVHGAQLQRIHQMYIDAELERDRLELVAQYGDRARSMPLPRTAAQRSADAMIAMAFDAVQHHLSGHGPHDDSSSAASPIVLNVVIADAVLAATEARAGGDRFAMPAGDPKDWRCETIDGVPLDPSEVLIAAISGQVRRVVRDAAGNISDFGRRRRTFTGPLREAVLTTATHCGFAGCDVPTSRCQVDHVTEWSHEGCTDGTNFEILCGWHNRVRNIGYEILTDLLGYLRTYRPDGSRI